MGERVPCPYCGRLVDEDDIERPADYCHHETYRFRPDHNGECLHCDEWADAHGTQGECPTDPGQAVANSEAHHDLLPPRASAIAWQYLRADFRLGMIEAAKNAMRSIDPTAVYDGHLDLCSNYLQPADGCWQCRIIREGMTDDEHH